MRQRVFTRLFWIGLGSLVSLTSPHATIGGAHVAPSSGKAAGASPSAPRCGWVVGPRTSIRGVSCPGEASSQGATGVSPWGPTIITLLKRTIPPTAVTTAAWMDDEFRAIIQEVARLYAIDPAIIAAIIHVESNFNPRARSHRGAMGLMQLMPGTARMMGVSAPFDPVQNIRGGTRYFRSLLDQFEGDILLALAAYNAGPGAVARYGRIPPYGETERYVPKVVHYYHRFARLLQGLASPPQRAKPVGSPPLARSARWGTSSSTQLRWVPGLGRRHTPLQRHSRVKAQLCWAAKQSRRLCGV
ncbi:MAG: lytic transglycosylase domain-containing protein [Deltaproteobacteria bacterium]|nr:lytic transglycosylase domain-containing protein [Deltaproteobacteria bacterium]